MKKKRIGGHQTPYLPRLWNTPLLLYPRHLASDSSNGVHQLVLSLLRGAGVMASEEVFDADTLKTKLTMVGAQLVYTVLTLLPVPLLYSSYTAR